MRKESRGLSYKARGAMVCSLNGLGWCRDVDLVIPSRVWFKGSVIEIDSYAFRGCNHLRSVVIPEGVTFIGEGAFENCVNLETVVLPNSLRIIDAGAFSSCKKLKSISFPSQVKRIREKTFLDCTALETVDFGNVETVEDHAFSNCISLMRADLSSIDEIGKHAFAGCDSLKEILIGENMRQMDATSFSESGYTKNPANWKGATLMLDRWVIAVNSSVKPLVVLRDTVGIAANVWNAPELIKRTRNPEYDDLLQMAEVAIVCPNVSYPDFTGVPEYLEEYATISVEYEGTLEEWQKIRKPRGENRFPFTLVAEEQTVNLQT